MGESSILAEVGSFASLLSVLAWAQGRTPPAALVTVVTQDEFTNDVVFLAAPGLFVVFDAT
jgi:hypothetical protein